MKNKKLSILLILVAGIWGTIGFKIYQRLTDEPEKSRPQNRRITSDTVKQEVYSLLLSYDDPFLKKKIVQPKPRVKKEIKITQPINVVPQITIDWSKIQYFGVLYNASKRIPTAAIKIGSTEYFVKEGSSVEGFVVSEILSDSIKFSIQNQSKYIKRQ
jgi:hypothetical protein